MSELHRVRVTCPQCRHAQDITADNVSGDTPVHCADCHYPLGKWRNLVEERGAAA